MLLFFLAAAAGTALRDSSQRISLSNLPTSRRLLGDHDHDSNGYVCPPVSDVSLPNQAFGVGNMSSGLYYVDNMTCKWNFDGKGKSVTLVFSMFHIENGYDKVEIFNNGIKVDVTLTGELVVPSAVRILNAGRVEVRFQSDDTYHLPTSPNIIQSFQIGFKASFMWSDQGQCPGNCTDELSGVCRTGSCSCQMGRLGADCSIVAPLLKPEETRTISNLSVGSWAYFRVEDPAKNLLVEVKDFGDATSDLFLAVSADAPTFSANLAYTDWFNWYYDASDFHTVRISNSGPLYYVGVTNHLLRSQGLVNANVTLRESTLDKRPCIANCSGHGTCNNGNCKCDAGFTGDHMGQTVCNFPIKSVLTSEFPYQTSASVRVGDWIYFKFTLTAAEVRNGSSLLVSLWSSSPRARPILLLAKGFEPDLAWGYLPTYDAFDAGFGDESGFGMLNGMQQNILVKGSKLTAGDWYVGVFNIWGFTGIDIESHDTAQVEVYFNRFEAGSPCPRANNDFCSGEFCDFNTGACRCPVTKLGSACGFQATEIIHQQPTALQTLNVGQTKYYVLNVSAHTFELGRNFELTLSRAPAFSKAMVYLLARKDAIPFSENYTEWDDHAFAMSYYHENEMKIYLDREELSMGLWYFAVINTQQSPEVVEYTLVGEFKEAMVCPASETTPPQLCYARGTCDTDLGRCVCQPGATMDDCSAAGLFLLKSDQPSTNTPTIAKDYWAYWGFGVGCENMTVEVKFAEDVPAGTAHVSAPMLAMRQNRLPLMVEGTFDYTDFYRGLSRHMPTQAIRIQKCSEFQGIQSCVVSPYPGGTQYATGFVKPGIWFIGIYNDFLESDGPIQNYSLTVSTKGNCSKCAHGFLGEKCDVMCPGMWPERAFANSPFPAGQSCSGHGNCSWDGQSAVCKCDEFYHGAACERSCPGMREENGTMRPCSRHGTCNFPKCICDPGYTGEDCSVNCPGMNTTGKVCSGLGECLVNGDGDSVCKCNQGYAGADCGHMCANKCYSHGECIMVLDPLSASLKPECECAKGFGGADCSLQCPGLASEAGACRGRGVCQFGSSASCNCFSGFSGDECEKELVAPTQAPVPGSSSGNSAGLVAVLVIVLIIAAGGIAYLVRVVKRQKAALRRYEAPMLDDEADAPKGEPTQPRGQEMQTLNKAPDSESLQDIPLEKVEYL